MSKKSTIDFNDWTFHQPFEILKAAKARSNKYGDLTIEALKDKARAYQSKAGKQGLGDCRSRDELSLFWDNILCGSNISHNSPGFRAISKQGPEIVSKRVTADTLSLYAFRKNSGAPTDPCMVISTNANDIIHGSLDPGMPSNSSAESAVATKADIEKLFNQMTQVMAQTQGIGELKSEVKEIGTKVIDIEDRLESLEVAEHVPPGLATKLEKIEGDFAVRIANLEATANLEVEPETAYQRYLTSKAQYFDSVERHIREGFLEITITDASRYILENFENTFSINEQQLQQDLKATYYIVSKSKTKNGKWRAKLKICDDGVYSAQAITTNLIERRTEFKGKLGIRAALPDEAESFRYTWHRWIDLKVILCYDYSKSGSYILYVHDPSLGALDLNSPKSISELKALAKPLRVHAPKHLAMMVKPTKEKLFLLMGNEHFVFNGAIFPKPAKQALGLSSNPSHANPGPPLSLPANTDINIRNFQDLNPGPASTQI